LSLEEGLASVAQQLVLRLEKEVPPERLRILLTDALLLTGLRVRRDVAAKIFRGVRAMQESDTYLAILDEGRLAEIKASILRLGRLRFGEPGESVTTAINALEDLEHLRRI